MSNEVGISIDTSDGKVLISYQKPMQWLEFSPQQAVDYAEAILNKAIYLADSHQSPIIMPKVS